MALVLSSDGDSLLQQAAASNTPKVQITTVRLFTGVNYPVTAGTQPLGAQVYSGSLTSVCRIGDRKLEIILDVPPQASGFSFGTIALYTSDAKLFAVHAYPSPVEVGSLATDRKEVFRLRAALDITTPVSTSVEVTPTGFFSVGTYVPADTPPAVNSTNAWQLTSPTSPTVLLVPNIAGTSWVPIGHTFIQNVTPSTVTTASGNTVFTIPVGTVFDSTAASMLARYLIVGPLGEIAQVSSVVTSLTTHTFTLSNTFAWVTTSAVLAVWENGVLAFSTHASLSQVSAHSQYMTSAILDPLYTPLSHGTELNPHAFYLQKTTAASTLVPLSHLSVSDSHTQYLPSIQAAAAYLSSAVNQPVQDALNGTRFVFNRNPDSSGSLTTMRSGMSGMNSRGSVYEFLGSFSDPSLYIKHDGLFASPMLDLAVSDFSDNIASTEWFSNRITTPGPRILRSVSSLDSPLSPLPSYEGFHVYTGDSIRFLDINTVMEPNGVYELLFNLVANQAAGGVELQPDNGLYNTQFKTYRLPRRVLDTNWITHPSPAIDELTHTSIVNTNNTSFGNPAPSVTLEYDNIPVSDNPFALTDQGIEGAQQVSAIVDIACATGFIWGDRHAALLVGVNSQGAGMSLVTRNNTLALVLRGANNTTTTIASVAIATLSQSLWYKLELLLTADFLAGVTMAVGRLWDSTKSNMIAQVSGTFSTTTIDRYCGFASGSPVNPEEHSKVAFDNLTVTSDYPARSSTNFRMVAPLRFGYSLNPQGNRSVSGRMRLYPSQGAIEYTVSSGVDFAEGSIRSLDPFTWSSVGRLGTQSSWSSTSSSGYRMWAAVRRIF